MATETEPFTNLSSWTVKLRRHGIAWFWEAEHVNGSRLDADLGCFDKANAEAEAVKALERYERGETFEEVNGFQLSKRVRERET